MTQTAQETQNFSDLLVVGGGAAGLAISLAASQAGFRVILADSGPLQRPIRADSRAYAIAPASMRLFSALGLGRQLAEAAQPVNRMAIADSDGGDPRKSVIRLDFGVEAEASGADKPIAFIVENKDLLEALLGAVAVAPGLVLMPGKRLVGLGQSEGRAVARFEDGCIINAQLVIGADGRGSSLRNFCAIDVSGWEYAQTAITASLTHSKPHGGVAYDFFLPSGPLGVLPLRGRRSSIVWCEKPAVAAELLKLPPDQFCAELNARLDGRLGALALEGERHSFPLSVLMADRMIAPRAALIGDAAHGIHPLAGQGLNIGLRDVAALADVLIDARAIGLDIGAETTLERYQRWRRFDNLSYAASMDALNRVFALRAPPLRALRAAGLAVVNSIKPLRKMFEAEASGVSESAPRLLRGESLTRV